MRSSRIRLGVFILDISANIDTLTRGIDIDIVGVCLPGCVSQLLAS